MKINYINVSNNKYLNNIDGEAILYKVKPNLKLCTSRGRMFAKFMVGKVASHSPPKRKTKGPTDFKDLEILPETVVLLFKIVNSKVEID